MRVLALLLAISVLAVGTALAVGSVPLAPGAVLTALSGEGEAMTRNIVVELRLPRALAAFGTGGLLAVAGALMQVLLRNPLADPYVLGISGGAAVCALSAIMLGAAAATVSAAAFAGALGSTLLVFGLARGAGSWTPERLLLTGIVVASGWGALISFLLATSPDTDLSGMLFWLMGDLSGTSSGTLPLAALGLVVILALPLGRSLNVLARGPLQAGALGVSVSAVQLAIYGLASLATATAVTVAGSVGFVGLVVPHMIRLAAGNDQRLLLPAAALLGGALLTLADTLARTVMAPQQLPVGVITALLGVPVFLYLLNRQRGGV